MSKKKYKGNRKRKKGLDKANNTANSLENKAVSKVENLNNDSVEIIEKEEIDIEYILDRFTNDTDLTIAQINFVNKFLETGNASKAYRETIFKTKQGSVSENSIGELASRELRKIQVRDYLDKVRKTKILSTYKFNTTLNLLINTLIELMIDDSKENENARLVAIREYSRLVRENIIVDTDKDIRFTPLKYTTADNNALADSVTDVTDTNDKFNILRKEIEKQQKREIIESLDLSEISLEDLQRLKTK